MRTKTNCGHLWARPIDFPLAFDMAESGRHNLCYISLTEQVSSYLHTKGQEASIYISESCGCSQLLSQVNEFVELFTRMSKSFHFNKRKLRRFFVEIQ